MFFFNIIFINQAEFSKAVIITGKYIHIILKPVFRFNGIFSYFQIQYMYYFFTFLGFLVYISEFYLTSIPT